MYLVKGVQIDSKMFNETEYVKVEQKYESNGSRDNMIGGKSKIRYNRYHDHQWWKVYFINYAKDSLSIAQKYVIVEIK